MNNTNWYRKMTEAQLKGRRVVATRDLQTGQIRVPAGTVLTVQRKFGGLDLISDPCPHCGIRPFLRRVPPQALNLLD